MIKKPSTNQIIILTIVLCLILPIIFFLYVNSLKSYDSNHTGKLFLAVFVIMMCIVGLLIEIIRAILNKINIYCINNFKYIPISFKNIVIYSILQLVVWFFGYCYAIPIKSWLVFIAVISILPIFYSLIIASKTNIKIGIICSAILWFISLTFVVIIYLYWASKNSGMTEDEKRERRNRGEIIF